MWKDQFEFRDLRIQEKNISSCVVRVRAVARRDSFKMFTWFGKTLFDRLCSNHFSVCQGLFQGILHSQVPSNAGQKQDNFPWREGQLFVLFEHFNT